MEWALIIAQLLLDLGVVKSIVEGLSVASSKGAITEQMAVDALTEHYAELDSTMTRHDAKVAATKALLSAQGDESSSS